MLLFDYFFTKSAAPTASTAEQPRHPRDSPDGLRRSQRIAFAVNTLIHLIYPSLKEKRLPNEGKAKTGTLFSTGLLGFKLCGVLRDFFLLSFPPISGFAFSCLIGVQNFACRPRCAYRDSPHGGEFEEKLRTRDERGFFPKPQIGAARGDEQGRVAVHSS